MIGAVQPNPAEAAAAAAWEVLRGCLDDGSSFVFEAGAGAGKTYSLIAALRYVLRDRTRELQRAHQQVACVTYTNVARDMIIAQTDSDPTIYCDTTHAFAWMLVSPFQKRLRELVHTLPGWGRPRRRSCRREHLRRSGTRLADAPSKMARRTSHHDDIIPVFIETDAIREVPQLSGVAFPFNSCRRVPGHECQSD